MPKRIDPQPRGAFTLIELLIVVAIIAILAAIAVPNFLEAQTRSKISRAQADMRSIAVAIEAYRVDFNRLAPPRNNGADPAYPGLPAFWGFTPTNLTTPVAYLTSVPVNPFTDVATANFWRNQFGGTQANQPFLYIYDTRMAAEFDWIDPAAPDGIPRDYTQSDVGIYQALAEQSGYILLSGGPDRLNGAVWGVGVVYDPTNGTLSYGDVFRFGSGTKDDTGRSFNYERAI